MLTYQQYLHIGNWINNLILGKNICLRDYSFLVFYFFFNIFFKIYAFLLVFQRKIGILKGITGSNVRRKFILIFD